MVWRRVIVPDIANANLWITYSEELNLLNILHDDAPSAPCRFKKLLAWSIQLPAQKGRGGAVKPVRPLGLEPRTLEV